MKYLFFVCLLFCLLFPNISFPYQDITTEIDSTTVVESANQVENTLQDTKEQEADQIEEVESNTTDTKLACKYFRFIFIVLLLKAKIQEHVILLVQVKNGNYYP